MSLPCISLVYVSRRSVGGLHHALGYRVERASVVIRFEHGCGAVGVLGRSAIGLVLHSFDDTTTTSAGDRVACAKHAKYSPVEENSKQGTKQRSHLVEPVVPGKAAVDNCRRKGAGWVQGA